MSLRFRASALNCDGAMESASIRVICGQSAMLRWVNNAMFFAFLAVLAVKLRWDGSTRLEHYHAFAAAGVFDPPGHAETRSRGEGCDAIGLILTDLEDGAATGPQQSREILDEASHEIQPVGTAIEGRGRIVVNLPWQRFEIGGPDVGQIGDDEIPGWVHGGGQISFVELDLDLVSSGVGAGHSQCLR